MGSPRLRKFSWIRNERGGKIHGKVEKKFGEAIQEDVEQVLDEFGICGVKIQIDDLGAWDFAIKARVRTAVKRALAQKGGEPA